MNIDKIDVDTVLNDEAAFDEVIKKCFECFDPEGLGFIQKIDFLDVVNMVCQAMGLDILSEDETVGMYESIETEHIDKISKEEIGPFLKYLIEALHNDAKGDN